jgi:hypothetical protein
MTPSNGTNITTATTTVVKGSAGILRRITINTTAAGAITVYDNTSATGTKIATFPLSVGVGSYEFGCRFNTGLTVVTAAASDITVIWE